MIIASLAMFTFPKHLRGDRIPPPVKLRAIESAKKMDILQKEIESKKPRLRDFPKTIRRQLNNDILMFRTASSVLHLLPVAGLYTFLPKYLESQFHLAPHESSLITGIYGILMMGVGIVISGIVIMKISPTARLVAGYIAFTAIVYSAGMRYSVHYTAFRRNFLIVFVEIVGMAILMFVGCSMDDLIGMRNQSHVTAPSQYTTNANVNMNSGLFSNRASSNFELHSTVLCNSSCICDPNIFSPICGSDGKSYYSACHAGCSIATMVNGKMQFKDCGCIATQNGMQI